MSQKITVCRSTLSIMKYSLIWPKEDEELNPTMWYIVRVIVFILITLGWVLSCIAHLITSVKTKADINLSEDVAMITAFIGLYIMGACYVKNQQKTAQVLIDLSDFHDFGVPPNFKKISKRLSITSYVLFAYGAVGVATYHSGKFLKIPECKRNNIDRGLHEICGAIIPTWVPFDTYVFPRWHLLILYQMIASQVLMKLALMISFMAMEMANHLILRIDHLNSMILKCFDDFDPIINSENLKNCIKYHQQILDISKRLNDCFKDGMLVHLTITGAICGCLENQFVKTNDKILTLIHCIGWMMALFVACLGGQHIINAGNSIPEAIYNTKWYYATIPQRKDLLFMLMRAQKGLHLQTGGFGILGYPMFLSVMKMSYSILALLTS